MVELVLASGLENAWVSVVPFLAEPQGYSFDAFFGSQEVLDGLVGAWWFLALFIVQAIFNTILGEEFLLRGVLLPKMEGADAQVGLQTVYSSVSITFTCPG